MLTTPLLRQGGRPMARNTARSTDYSSKFYSGDASEPDENQIATYNLEQENQRLRQEVKRLEAKVRCAVKVLVPHSADGLNGGGTGKR
jgi:hypothetical protein